VQQEVDSLLHLAT